MNMKSMRHLLIGLPLMIFMTDAFAWSLVYSNDATGKTKFGNLSTLINAVKQGQDVKVFVDDGAGFYAQCQMVYLGVGYVTCDLPSELSTQNVAPGPDFGFKDDAYYGFYMLNTKGQAAISRWSVGEHTDRGKTLTAYPMKWYVN